MFSGQILDKLKTQKCKTSFVKIAQMALEKNLAPNVLIFKNNTK